MKIAQMLDRREPVVSFEFFPPRSEQAEEELFRTVDALRACRPSFVSVTYGAQGNTRDLTLDLVARIKRELAMEPLAHLTCVGSGRDEIRRVLDRLLAAGIENVLALRGDPPPGEGRFQAPPGGFAHASELVSFVREQGLPLCIGAACYPEGHPDCPELEQDLDHLKHKVGCGVDFLITQLFFDNQDYFAFVRRARSAGIEVPIVPGLMPVTNVAQIHRFTKICGARIPQELYRRLRIVERDPAAVVAAGVLWTVTQGAELLAKGVPGLHFYTLNKSSATLAVHAALGL
ncbi:MAG: methylenetetrahydrofolate reductase [NAD(P)H] [Deltaproteobacteria bacterium]|nr:methylenetetrahydrofolate reductase [NAD(P)H] [Deltaproteobacteria bacterium]